MKIIIESAKTTARQTGIFWIATLSEEDLWMGKFNLISHKDIESHKDCWTKWAQKNDKFKKCTWDYWPRGKVMYSADKHSHTISLNDFIATAKVIQAVKERFSLTGEVKIEKNNSGEFDSLWFDREE